MQYKINIESRNAKGNLNALRSSGKIPAIMYGPKQESKTIAVSYNEFIKVFKDAGESSVVELVDKEGQYDALIHEVDYDPVTDIPRHIDFYVIEKGKKVEVAVPIVFDGVAPAVKEKGGILVKVMRELEIEASPKDLPHEIHVDISTLTEMDSRISASEIKLPSGVTLKTNPNETVASIAQVQEEKEDAPTSVDMSAIEVEKKGKEAKEGEAPTAEPASEEKKK